MCNDYANSLRELDDYDFEDYCLHDSVLILFTTNGCRYASAQRRILSEVDDPAFFIACCDLQTCINTSVRYNVFITPTLLLFRHGVLSDRVAGFRTKEELLELLNTWQIQKN